MEEIKPEYNGGDDGNRADYEGFFNPDVRGDGSRLVCSCGYALYKRDAETWACEGGHHVYRIRDGSASFDKFGNMVFSVPTNKEEQNKKTDVPNERKCGTDKQE